MVEFALTVPIFFLLTFGLIQFALIFAGYCGATYASQVAVRYAVVHGGTNATPCTAVNVSNIVAPYLWAAQKNSATVTTTWNPNNSAGSTVNVSITLVFKTGIPFSSVKTVTVGTSAQSSILY
jgi:Flp pilus assembly protein TadG